MRCRVAARYASLAELVESGSVLRLRHPIVQLRMPLERDWEAPKGTPFGIAWSGHDPPQSQVWDGKTRAGETVSPEQLEANYLGIRMRRFLGNLHLAPSATLQETNWTISYARRQSKMLLT